MTHRPENRGHPAESDATIAARIRWNERIHSERLSEHGIQRSTAFRYKNADGTRYLDAYLTARGNWGVRYAYDSRREIRLVGVFPTWRKARDCFAQQHRALDASEHAEILGWARLSSDLEREGPAIG